MTQVSIAQRTISAKIVEKATGVPISEVNLRLEDGSAGSISDSKGHFSLTVPDSHTGQKVIVSHVGYQTLTMSFGQLGPEIQLEEQVYQIGEVSIKFVDLRKLLVRKRKLDEASIDQLTQDYLARTKEKDTKRYESISKRPDTFKKAARLIRLTFHKNGTASLRALVLMGRSFEWKLNDDNRTIVVINKEGHESTKTISELTLNRLVMSGKSKSGESVEIGYVPVD